MNFKKISLLKEKIGDIQFGLLRFDDNNKQISLQVKITTNLDASLNCLVTDDYTQTLLDRNVNLIQKHQDDYLHISGRVTEERGISRKILFIKIERACWFVRHSKGSVSWLEQKYLYEPPVKMRA